MLAKRLLPPIPSVLIALALPVLLAIAVPAGASNTAGVPGASSPQPSKASVARRGRLPSGHAASSTQWGISDDSPFVFTDPRFVWLKMHTARIVMAWDVMFRRAELAWRNQWLAAAKAAGIKPLVVFSADPSHPHWLPTLAEYDKAVSRFMKSHPWVTEYTVWDEENHYTQPTSHDPGRAAQYFDLFAEMCRSCKVVAADVLDEPNMAGWIQRFLPDAHNPKIWGLHNYLDLNDDRSEGTRQLLGMVKGEVWFTETGGLVWRYEHKTKRYIVRGNAYAARAASRLHALAAMSSRVRRIYYYQWRVPVTLAQAERGHTITWDSGLIAPNCSLRPAFDIVARVLGHNPARAPRAKRNRAGACVASG